MNPHSTRLPRAFVILALAPVLFGCEGGVTAPAENEVIVIPGPVYSLADEEADAKIREVRRLLGLPEVPMGEEGTTGPDAVKSDRGAGVTTLFTNEDPPEIWMYWTGLYWHRASQFTIYSATGVRNGPAWVKHSVTYWMGDHGGAYTTTSPRTVSEYTTWRTVPCASPHPVEVWATTEHYAQNETGSDSKHSSSPRETCAQEPL